MKRPRLFILRGLWLVLFFLASYAPERLTAQQLLLDSLKRSWETVRSKPDDSAKVMLMNDLSEKYRLYANDLPKAQEYALLALKAARSIGFARGTGDALHRLSLLYFVQARYDTSRLYSASALTVRTNIHDTVGMGRSLNALGLTYQYQGNYGKASEHYFRALPLQEAVNDKVGLAVSCDNIGTCYRFQANYTRAIEFHERALAINREINNATHIPYPLMGLGTVYEALQRYDKALAYYTEALTLRMALHHRQGVAVSLNALGKLYNRMGRLPEALQTQKQALALQDSIQDRSGMASSLTEIGRLYAADHRYTEALLYSERALRLAEEIGSKTIMSEATALCADILRSQKRYKEALGYFVRSSALRDSIFSQKTAQQLADMATQREIDQKERDLVMLAKENEIKTSWRNGLLAVLILLSALMVVITMRYYDNKRANAEIMRQQAILSEQAREIELINTELQESNNELENKNEALVQMNDEKNEFLGIAAHDLKSPLSSIRLLAGVLHDEQGSIKHEQTRDSALLIRQLAEQMFGLIKNLLDVNAIEQGMMTLTSENVDIGMVLQIIIDQYTTAAKNKNITLAPALTPSLFVRADTMAVEQVLENLISNAVKFSPLGGTVNIALTDGRILHHDGTESVQNDYICICVRDEGAGILETDKPRLFGKFARLSARPTGNEHSTGLGLSIVKKMVDAMQGKVWCESEASQGRAGTTFIVQLPKV
ncbi:MAG: tetratricopeptide repeat-containing sensor histidine kinase [Ignavibacteria bacterium]|nr:tetratricopeptide repeat-containing sensor histidine kinase [Ignavibacteria bacterium]